MRTLVIYYRDGSRQVVKPRQEEEKWTIKNGKRILVPNSVPNFCGDWYGLVQAITKGYYLSYEVI